MAVKMKADQFNACLLNISDAADEEDSVELDGQRTIKKNR